MKRASRRQRIEPSAISPRVRAAIRRKLLRWYDRHKRDLPWRQRGGDPYAQWVAEIMLQQTRVETVAPYYLRFLRRFPDVRSLAEGRHEEVLKHWEGLGYYRRALHLHRAAKALRDEGRGVPQSAEELLALPGIGEYTAAAIASIAFGESAVAVDGNVARVLSRLFGVTEDVTTTIGRTRIRQLAGELIPASRPGDFNQAWMDLGSGICVPRSPNCDACPLRGDCVAAAKGIASALPVRNAGRRVDIPAVSLLTVIFVHRGHMLIRRRPPGGLWSRLWEFPGMEIDGHLPDVGSVRRIARDVGVSVNGRPRWKGIVKHQLTHRSLTFHVAVVDVEPPVVHAVVPSHRWVTARRFAALSVSTAHRWIYHAARRDRAMTGTARKSTPAQVIAAPSKKP